MFEEVVSELLDLSDTKLHDRIGELELLRRRTETELATAIAVADARQLYRTDAHRSMKGYLKATCNWSDIETKRWRSAATAVNLHPSIGDAWIRGRIGSPQVTLLATTNGNRRIRDQFPKFLPHLLANAEEMCFDDFATSVDVFIDQADADGAHDGRDDAIEHRRARVVKVGETLDIGVFGGNGLITDEAISIFEAFCDAEFRNDLSARRDLHGPDALDHDLPRTAGQRSFDAMIAIFRAAAASDSAGTAADTIVNIVIDAATFARINAAAGLAPTSIDGVTIDPFTGLAAANTLLDDLMIDPTKLNTIRCETDRRTPIHPHDVLRAALAGHIRRVVLEGDGHIIDFGRKKRLFEGAAREAAKLLIRRCQHPGCDLPTSWSQVDHNIEWNELGETNQNNGGIQCAVHNVAKHRLELHRRRAANGVDYTIRPDGTIILPIGARTPQFDPDERPDDPDQIRELEHLARARLEALRSDHAA